jgi:intein/homing endonuclease
VQVFDLQTYELQSKPVSELREGELLASCFRVPNNESLTSVNIAEMILREGLIPDGNLFVMGEESRALAKEIRSKYEKKKVRSEYPTLRNSETTKLSYFRKEGRLPTGGSLRLRYSRHDIPVVLPITRQLARLLGYHVAEGGLSGGKRGSCCELTFSLSEMSYVKDAVNCVQRIFRLKPKIERFRSKVRIRYGGTLLARVISEVLASGKNVYDRRVPYIMFNVPDRFKIEFLRGYFRGDRMINYRENTRLAAKTVSRLLAADLVVLLRQLDCVAYTYKQGEYYVVALANTERIQEVVDELCGRTVKVNSKLLSMPGDIVYPLRHQIKSAAPYGKRTQIHNKLFTNGTKARVGYAKLKEILNTIPHKNNRYIETIRALVENRVVLLPLVEKRRLSMMSPTDVYDIEVSNDHTFVGGLGGIVLHNSDIVEYKLPSDKLTELDIKRLYELKKDPRYEGKLWNREIETFMKIKKKAEQEAFSRYGLTYIVDEYLPAKLEMVGSE